MEKRENQTDKRILATESTENTEDTGKNRPNEPKRHFNNLAFFVRRSFDRLTSFLRFTQIITDFQHLADAN